MVNLDLFVQSHHQANFVQRSTAVMLHLFMILPIQPQHNPATLVCLCMYSLTLRKDELELST